MARKMQLPHLLAHATACFLLATMFSGPAGAAGYVLPDTGQTKCYDNSGEIPCPASGQAFYGQDGNYQGPQPDYQLSADGLTVGDLNTGLTWQQADDGVTKNWNEAEAYCEKLKLGGYSDWRLPSCMELVSIVNYGGIYPHPHINPVFGARSSYYWSGSSIYSNPPGDAWCVHFGYGGAFAGTSKSRTYYVRCVRGGPVQFGPFVDNHDGTVTDTSTTLMWQQSGDAVKRNWQSALSYCEDLDLAEQTDWRLPNIRELWSLVDVSRYRPAINPVFALWGGVYVSCTTPAYWPSNGWKTDFNHGYTDFGNWKGDFYDVRCVRGGPTGALDQLVLPTSQHLFNVSGTVDPILSNDPAQAVPIGIGPVAAGGSILRLRVATEAMSGPADIYLGIYMPDLAPEHIYLLGPDLTFRSHLEGIVPWKQNSSGLVNENLFSDILTSQLPGGTYYFYLAITPSGQKFGGGLYLWIVTFEIM